MYLVERKFLSLTVLKPKYIENLGLICLDHIMHGGVLLMLFGGLASVWLLFRICYENIYLIKREVKNEFTLKFTTYLQVNSADVLNNINLIIVSLILLIFPK